MKISLELVPNNPQKLEEEAKMVKSKFHQIDMINIPDLATYDLRSWEACNIIKPYYKRAIPHIRAIDFDYLEPLPFIEKLKESNIEEVLVLKGDPPQNMSKKVYTTNTIDMIYKLKRELPELKIYAAIDQYRSSMKKEYEYIQHKLNAGVDGFFTQPFFDMRYLDIYTDMLKGTEVYIGIAPVLSKISASYWKTKNDVIFPKDFTPTKEWNTNYAKKAMEAIEKHDNHVYFMPIIVDVNHYLSSIFL